MIQETYNTTQTEANNIYIKTEKINTIQTPPIDQYDCLKSGSNAICRIENYDFVINTETMEATYKNFYPLKFYFVENGNVYLNEFDTPNPLPYVLIMYERAGNYHAILVDEETSESIFIKMLYLEGYGLTKFEKVYEYVQPETKKAVVYRLLPKTNSTQNDNQ